MKPLLLATALLASLATLSAQQHNFTAGDVEEGGKLYRQNCIGCHGPEGTGVTGIDLGHARFRRSSTDEEVVNVIMNGISGTGMPGLITNNSRAWMVLGYLKNMNEHAGTKSIAAANGDVTRGQALFNGKGNCASCHRIKGSGGRLGPDLSEVGLTLRPIEIETSLLDPDKDASLASQPYRVVRKDGTALTGLLLNQDTYTVQLLDSAGKLHSLSRAPLKESGFAKSPMPSYRGKLNAQELADLIAYLAAQRGAN